MKKLHLGLLVPLVMILSGCSAIGEKTASVSLIYGAAAVLSFLLLIGYCCAIRKKDGWFLLLLASVLVVNLGYFSLSVSKNLAEALLANRISYLGSVMLPLSMLMIILGTTGLRHPKWLPGGLLGLALVVLFVAASPGYLTVYYKDVSLKIVNGVSSLDKVYGPLHFLYLVYLLGYFSAMTAVILYAAHKKKLDSRGHAAVLLIAVFVNICVWLAEQLVQIDFEILSISYIISELFLLGLNLLLLENKPTLIPQPTPEPTPTEPPEPRILPDPDRLRTLTPTERTIFNAYLAGHTTKEIMSDLNIKENTLKFHNKNLYGKLGVSSRKQLIEIYSHLPLEKA